MATKPPATPAEAPQGAPSTSTEVAAPRVTAVAMPGDWKQRMKDVAIKSAEAEKPTSTFISFKSGRLSIGDMLMPGDKIECVVIHSLFHNKWYEQEYDAKRGPVAPNCYAFAKDDVADLEYSEAAEDPQGNEDGFCTGCPKNEWGSSPKGGRGKACQNSKRVWLFPAGVVNTPEKIARMEPLQCDLPVTSVANYSRFINDIAPMGLPSFGVICEMSVKPHDTSLFQVHFKVLEKIKDDVVLEALARFNWAMENAPHPTYPLQSELDERGGDQTGRGANAPASKKY